MGVQNAFGSIQKHSESVQIAFRLHSECIQKVLRMHSESVQNAFGKSFRKSFRNSFRKSFRKHSESAFGIRIHGNVDSLIFVVDPSIINGKCKV